MKTPGTWGLLLAGIVLLGLLHCGGSETPPAPLAGLRSPYGEARPVGRLQDDRLLECSGMDASTAREGLFWAINDGGNGPYLYALGGGGESLGRVQVTGADNRDWEGIATFRWQGRSMILIADAGDNRRRRETYRLFILPEPPLRQGRLDPFATAAVSWRIRFRYPDRPHDAEGVAVDPAAGKVLLLTKRDIPPLLFELPLAPGNPDRLVTARKVASLGRIPQPSPMDLMHRYGLIQAQPTALDISFDGRRAVVLTYTHAYLFERGSRSSWGAAFSADPIRLPLPLPLNRSDLRQREAICFSPDDRAIFVTSEGEGAGIYRLDAR